MALILADRVKENTTTTGTGTIVLGGAQTGYQSFAVVGNGNTTYYTIADQTGPTWEVGIGTYYSGNVSLARTTILSSSNAGAVANFTAGTKDVFVTYPSEKSVNLDSGSATNATAISPVFAASNGLILNNANVSANYTIATGYNAMSVGPITVLANVAVTVSSGNRWLVL
jgi:hypothetical protein